MSSTTDNPQAENPSTGAAPISTELPKQYRPADHESRIWNRWEDSKAFHADPGRVLSGEAKPYSVVIPPPNVTAALHLGHALNNSIQDILVRAHRMKGYETLWMPGTDHAGIATQAVVEKRVQKEEKKRRTDFTREEFVAKIQAFKDEYEATITDQLKKMGCSCDWDRQRFTMDEVCAKAVREAFFRLFRDGLIYRGKRLVNWDPALQTAVADDECYDEEIDAKFYYLRYPLVHPHGATTQKERKQGELPPSDAVPVTWSELQSRGYPGAEQHADEQEAWVTVATTRPETYLADTAVAVNPHDPRAKALRGLCVELPLVGRVIPIVEDDYVVLPAADSPYSPTQFSSTGFQPVSFLPSTLPSGTGFQPVSTPSTSSSSSEPEDPKAKFATGFLKVTPAHDANDYELYQRHKERMDTFAGGQDKALINMMSPDGRVSDKHGWTDLGDAHILVGKKMAEARKLVIDEFQARTVGNESLFEEAKPYRHSVKHSDRSKAVIEPYLSDQWYVKVTDPRMAAAANEALVPEQVSSSSPSTQSSGAGFQPASTTPTSSSPITESLNISKRRLPHWQMGGSTYFITFRVAQGSMSPAERDIVLSAIKHWDGQRLELHAAVVMPDHVHILFSPFIKEDGTWHSLSELLHSIKRHSAQQIQARRSAAGAFWQDESFDRIVRDEDEFTEKLNYIIKNPGNAGVENAGEKYPWLLVIPEAMEAKLRFVERVRGRRTGSEGVERVEGRLKTCPTSGSSQDQEEGSKDKEGGEDTNHLRFYPARYAKTYELWHDNIRDWCISRQLWWGHRIPVWRSELTIEAGDIAEAGLFGAYGMDHLVRREYEHGVIRATDELGKEVDPSELLRIDRHNVRRFRVYVCYDGSDPLDDTRLESAEEWSLDPDVLDTWFSSSLWPISTMGWPDFDSSSSPPPSPSGAGFQPASTPSTSSLSSSTSSSSSSSSPLQGLLQAFNPTSALCTAREIITLWVSRMVMMNRYFMGEGQGRGPVPFHDVFIHAMIQDGEGRKMSKSLGNGVDPLDIIASHGADAMRFTLCQMTTQTQDVRMPVVKDSTSGRNTSPKFDLGRNFANKLWNAARFTSGILTAPASSFSSTQPSGTGVPPLSSTPSTSSSSTGFQPVSTSSTSSSSSPSLADRWLLSRLASAVAEADKALREYQFSTYAQVCYDLLWRDFCDWYLEAIKPTVANDPHQRAVLRAAMDTILRLLHPIMPFVTEAIYEQFRELKAEPIAGIDLVPPRNSGLLCTAGWPKVSSEFIDPSAEGEFERLRMLITSIREVRAQRQIIPKRKITLHATAELAAAMNDQGGFVSLMAGLERITTDQPASASIKFRFESGELSLSNLADADTLPADDGAEKARLQKQIADLEKSAATLTARLANPGYADKAPPAMVRQTRDQLAKVNADLAALRSVLERIGGAVA